MTFSENNLGNFELRIGVEALKRIRVSIFIFLRIEFIGPQSEASAKIELPIPVCLHRAGLDTAKSEELWNGINRGIHHRASVLVCNSTFDLPV
jgi:hypothetical protein